MASEPFNTELWFQVLSVKLGCGSEDQGDEFCRTKADGQGQVLKLVGITEKSTTCATAHPLNFPGSMQLIASSACNRVAAMLRYPWMKDLAAICGGGHKILELTQA